MIQKGRRIVVQNGTVRVRASVQQVLKRDVPPLGRPVEAHHLEQIQRLRAVQNRGQLSTAAARVPPFAMLLEAVTEREDELLLLVERYGRENG